MEYADLGPHHAGIDGTLTAVEQRGATELYSANTVVYVLQMNVKRAISVAMNGAVPESFHRLAGAQLGSSTYKATDYPREILESLQDNWGLTTPGEKA